VLLVEYRSGLFQQNNPYNSSNAVVVGWITISILIVTVGLFVSQCLFIWFRPYKHVREEFALAAFCVAATTTLVVMSCLALRVTPWSAIALAIAVIWGRSTNWQSPQ